MHEISCALKRLFQCLCCGDAKATKVLVGRHFALPSPPHCCTYNNWSKVMNVLDFKTNRNLVNIKSSNEYTDKRVSNRLLSNKHLLPPPTHKQKLVCEHQHHAVEKSRGNCGMLDSN